MILLREYFSLLKMFTVLSSGYLDPGSGSFILQVLVASLVGIGFVLRGYWSKVTNLFRKKPNEEELDKQDHE